MNKHLITVLILSGLLSACSGPSSSSIPLSPACQSHFDLATVFVDKLEATGRFPPDQIDCLRHNFAVRTAAHQNPAIRALPQNADQEKVDNSCRGGELTLKVEIKKAEEIPHLSQEEFDAEWGKIECRRI
jgi:hypothetical protein